MIGDGDAPRRAQRELERALGIEDEVAWGESREGRILKTWMSLSTYAHGAARVIKSNDYDDFDFLLLTKPGLPLCYVEVKVRRTGFGKYGDAIFPMRKHEFAKQLSRHKLPFVGVTLYGDGTLVEVDLTKAPSSQRDITRRDRPGMKPVPHGFYSKRQLTVLTAE